MSALAPLPLPTTLYPPTSRLLPSPASSAASTAASTAAAAPPSAASIQALQLQAHLLHLANYLKLQALIGQHLDQLSNTPPPAPALGPPPKVLEDMAKLIEPLGPISHFNQMA